MLVLTSEIIDFPGSASGKTPPVNAGDVRGMGWIPGSGRSPGGRGNGTLESHGQSGLEGYSPWSHKESDTSERLSHSEIICLILKSLSDSICRRQKKKKISGEESCGLRYNIFLLT